MTSSDPWITAWMKLKTVIDMGATKEEVTEYARQLQRELPPVTSPEVAAQHANAIRYVITDILNERD